MLLIFKNDDEILVGWIKSSTRQVFNRVSLNDKSLIDVLKSNQLIPDESKVYNKFLHLPISTKDDISKKLNLAEIILSDRYEMGKYKEHVIGEIIIGGNLFKSTDLKTPIGKIDYKTQIFKNDLGELYYTLDGVTCFKCNLQGSNIIVSSYPENTSDINLYEVSKNVSQYTEYSSINDLLNTLK